MMPKGDGSFYLYLHGNVRKASDTKVGDTVEVEIKFDATYRNGPMHPMPREFRMALNGNPIARQSWNKLIPSRKKEILKYFDALKSPDSRDRNYAKMMHILSGNDGRFMGRDWKDGK